jgi:hypothetical protein
MKPKIAIIIAQFIFLLFFTVLISNSWDFYFWPTYSFTECANQLTFVENFFEKEGRVIWVDKQSGSYDLIPYGKDYKKNLQLLKDHLKNNTEVRFDTCNVGTKKYFYNIQVGKKLLFSENDAITKLNSEKESTLRIIMFSGMLSLISCWVIIEIRKWIRCHPTA